MSKEKPRLFLMNTKIPFLIRFYLQDIKKEAYLSKINPPI